jgi:phage-related protein
MEAGELLGSLQQGRSLEFSHARPMSTIGAGCLELRVRDRNVDWRIFVHVAPDVVAFLEVFAKKTARTPQLVIADCRRRLAMFHANDTWGHSNESGQGKEAAHCELANWKHSGLSRPYGRGGAVAQYPVLPR